MRLYDLELNWIRELQNVLRSPLMDWFFIGWSFVDTLGFVLVAITLVWYLIDKKIGIKMFYILVLSGVINKLLKGYFDLPRPCQMDPSVGLMCLSSPGLPSGAAQTAIIYAGIIFIECKRRVYWIWGVVFALFLCFSRIYLGVHFFTDILGGLVVGGSLVLVYWKLFHRLERYWKPLLAIFPFLILLLVPKIGLPFFWLSLSVGIGIVMYDKKGLRKMPKWGIRITHAVCVLFGLSVCLIGMAFFPKLHLGFAILAGSWLSYLGPWLGDMIAKVYSSHLMR